MEACDDICYTVLDAEDAVKKGLVSYPDLVRSLEHRGKSDPLISRVLAKAENDHVSYRELPLSPAELNDLSMQKLRVHAVAEMIGAVYKAYTENRRVIEAGGLKQDLLSVSDAAELRKCLKSFDEEHAYRHRSVLAVESTGCNTIHGLMDVLWRAITLREPASPLGSPRDTPFLRYAYGRISENYRRIFEDPKNGMPARYKEAQLLTDMISGMTDSFAVALLKDLRKYDDSGSQERRHAATAG